MRITERTSTTPAITVPALEPVPVDGCDVCAALVRQREASRSVDPLTVQSCNEELASHPHRRADRS
ncbi:hypothetical protein [Streptomyces spiramyceticus]|uniref:hypothetical protein n=1 Tax=Streptomyces spiramyceticus TaxID=299717 RepID=UPI00237B6099|nr:hypothetical protein [Streptomyces spiramyceticus]